MNDDSEGPSDRAIGRRLALTRDALGLSQKELAEAAGIGESHMSGIINDKKKGGIGIEPARRLRKAFGLTLDWIYEGDMSGLRRDLAKAIEGIRAARAQSPRGGRKGPGSPQHRLIEH
jgi:transcriptional regulator with XRE-family HTH domain